MVYEMTHDGRRVEIKSAYATSEKRHHKPEAPTGPENPYSNSRFNGMGDSHPLRMRENECSTPEQHALQNIREARAYSSAILNGLPVANLVAEAIAHNRIVDWRESQGVATPEEISLRNEISMAIHKNDFKGAGAALTNAETRLTAHVTNIGAEAPAMHEPVMNEREFQANLDIAYFLRDQYHANAHCNDGPILSAAQARVAMMTTLLLEGGYHDHAVSFVSAVVQHFDGAGLYLPNQVSGEVALDKAMNEAVKEQCLDGIMPKGMVM